ncbi:MAG TPA: protein translocase subunit SecD [Verrucomicrobiae bacterium]|nr:protein translocase subunit SecD [Verrucomicrobiae bacterium]
MKRNNFWRLALVLGVLIWSFYEIYPPTNRDLVEQFVKDARVAPNDAVFATIVADARAAQKTNASRAYTNLRLAIGTNDITRYFPQFDARAEDDPNTFVLNRLQRRAAGKIKLGIDLQGGTSFTLEMDTNRFATITTTTNAVGEIVTTTNFVQSELEGVLNQAVEVLRKRVDRFGVAEPIIQPVGDNQIIVQLPGLSDADRESAKTQLQKTAFLEFRLVHENSDSLIRQGEIPPNYELLRRKQRNKNGTESVEEVLVKKRAERGLTGNIIKHAMVVRGNLGEPQINFTLNEEGTVTFGQVTRENVGRRLAIVLDGKLYSAPSINSPIETGSGQITGSFDVREAFELANVLENPLKAPLHIISSTDVDPTLGKDSIKSGIRASIIGIVAVAGFMLVYYLLSGAIANVALLSNVIILMGVMCSFGTTLTLPGIAGIVLTVGMAVDANVLIYERIREELAKGKSLRGAIAAGYDRAFGTIFDSHFTTLISSVILIALGTGPVKGFGVTLTIGVAASLFTALVVTRLIFDWLLGRDLITGLKMLHIIRVTKIDFMRWAVPAFAVSWVIILAGLGYGVLGRGKDLLGVEFSGGTMVTLKFDQSKDIGVDQIRSSATKAGVGESLIAYQKDLGNNSRTLRVTVRATGEAEGEAAAEKVVAQIKADFPDAKFEVAGEDHVGPTVGAELRNTAIVASVLAMFGILVYVAFRYEFSFATAAVIAIVHDVLMTVGCYFLSGRELNSSTVAAVLTIIGFSINDTIVIFDRIREDLKLGVRGSFRDLINQALNQTLSRTIITSGTVFLATMSLFIFGGGPVNDFAFTFLIGIITGTYSSIYIASAIVLWWHKGVRPNIGAQVATETVRAATNPVKV